MVKRRIGSVSPEERAILDRIAVCGPVSGDRHAEKALEELEKLDLVLIRSDGRRLVVDLAHPLYGEVLRSGVRRPHKRRLLLDSARELEHFGARRREDALKAAMWSLDATGTAASGQLQRALQLARHSQDSASVARLAPALSLLDPGAGPRMQHGEALYELGQFDAADRALRDAMETAVDDQEFMLASYLRTQCLAFGRMRLDDAMSVVDSTKARLREVPAEQALRVIEAGVHLFAGRTGRALELLTDLDTMPDPRIRVVGGLVKAYSLAEAGRTAEALALSDRSYQEHLKLPELFSTTTHPRTQLSTRTDILYRQGRLDEARRLGESTYDEVAAERVLVTQTWLANTLGDLEFAAGRRRRAHYWYATAEALASDHHFAAPHWTVLIRLAQLTAVLGDMDASDAYWEDAQRLEPTGHHRPEPFAAEAWRSAASGNSGAAREAFLRAADRAHYGGMYAAEAQYLFDVARLGGAGGVHRRLAELAAESDNPLTALQAEHVSALYHRDADSLLSIAVRFEDFGLLPAAAHSYGVAAEFFSARAEHGSATAAARHAAQLAARCQGSDVALHAAASPGPLTTREREIALLAAEGRSNREIADRLRLSARTVGNHLHSIYQKLGVASRKQLREAVVALQKDVQKESTRTRINPD
ncbi:LuxR C-terminal-related transcriptional regulator [Streptomyces sp. NPDC051776]|uniref:LuxR C-terminal-related transcriptional regulator n=1 Tax=Streptomyces sp. NPDC051776 TaxID=3155414 RepID=UPI00341E35FD